MDHFYDKVIDESYFSFEDVYSRAVRHFPSGSTFVEVGVLHGKSLAYLIVEAINSGKHFNIFGVDRFDWSRDQMERVHKNLEPVSDRYELLKGDSAEMASKFEDKSVSFLFLDSDHSYGCVKADIAAWLPKMAPSSWICGHDYDKASFPGCVRAVNEAFGDKVSFSVHTVWEHRIGS